ncbi:hypothetical protein [Bordetella sp. H567]|uniref:hypothetical protein n=1 Tax=Bordetella sp. H567 TaxID=1697043 RepID=UPI0011AB6368|nr:hypothetical protein [Bordetella sp. H567]
MARPTLPIPAPGDIRPTVPAEPAPCPDAAAADRPDPGSLLAARIAGARAILQDAAGDDDDVLLMAANEVHQKAVASPDDADAQEASLSLWRAEAAAWAAANDAPPSVDEAARLQAYLDLWSLALDPPVPPVFQTRRDIAREYVLELAQAGQPIAIADRPTIDPVPVDTLLDHYMEMPEVRIRYYRQFADYVDTHLDHFSKLGAIGDAVAAGIPRLRLEERPTRMWHIESLLAFPAGAHRLPSGGMLSALGRPLGESYVAEMPDGQFLHIDASGKMAKLPPGLADPAGQLKLLPLLCGLGLRADPATEAVNGDGDSDTEHMVACKPYEPVPLRGHIVALRRSAVHGAIAQWKTDNYLPSRTETVLRLVLPFYSLYHNVKWDPGYRLQAGDIAWDAAALAITVAGIALTAGGGSAGVVAAHASMRTVAAQGIKAMVKAGMRTVVQQFHIRALMLGGARELADFVLPVFSVGKLLKSAAHVTPLATQALKAATRSAGAALRAADARLLLDGIYEVLARTGPAHRNLTATTIRQSLEKAARRPVPMRVYRGPSGGPDRDMLRTPISPDASVDDILAATIRHKACAGGSPAHVLSLSANRPVSVHTDGAPPHPHILTIDTSAAPGRFRTIEDILLNDGPRLVQQGKIPSGTLRAAIMRSLENQEEEIFYIGGSIPDALVVGRQPVLADGAESSATVA